MKHTTRELTQHTLSSTALPLWKSEGELVQHAATTGRRPDCHHHGEQFVRDRHQQVRRGSAHRLPVYVGDVAAGDPRLNDTTVLLKAPLDLAGSLPTQDTLVGFIACSSPRSDTSTTASRVGS
jgi:hypothetical protein